MSKIAKSLLVGFVLVACASGGVGDVDLGPTSAARSGDAGAEENIARPSANLPGTVTSETRARLARTCTPPALTVAEERLRYGRAGAPPDVRAPRRILAKGDARDMATKGKALEAVFSPADEARAVKRGGPSLSFPANARDPFSLSDAKSGARATVSLVGAENVSARFVDGLLVYPRALGSADVVLRPELDGAEDSVLFGTKPSEETLAYRVTLGDQVAAVRFVAGTLELLDTEGTPRLRMAAPELVDGACNRIVPRVRVTDCTVDTDPRLPFRRPRQAPPVGAIPRVCTVKLDWSGMGTTYPATLDPSWSSTGSMVKAHAGHTATKTTLNGAAMVVVVGSYWGGAGDLVEAYDEGTGVWATVGVMASVRWRHAAAKLADGRVLVVGGKDVGAVLSAVETIDLSTGLIQPVASIPEGTASLSLDVLPDGRVLAYGGEGGNTPARAYLYRPNDDAWSLLTTPGHRLGHTSVAVGNEVFVLGGWTQVPADLVGETSVVKYTHVPNGVGTFSTLPVPVPASIGDISTQAVLVPGNPSKIFALGDRSTTPQYADLPNLSFWTASPPINGAGVKLGLRDVGPVTVGGGPPWGAGPIPSSTLYDNLKVAYPGPALPYLRVGHSLTFLQNGRLLAAGGGDPNDAKRTSDLLGEATCTLDAECDDQAPCTLDACSPEGRCTHVARDPGLLCFTDDGNVCNGVSTCGATGQCSTSPALTPDTCGSCDPVLGLVTSPAGTACSLAPSACRTAGHCDGSAATAAACKAELAPEGTPCEGGGSPNVCTGLSVCTKSGATMSCVTRPGIAGLADDHDPCTTDTCDPARGIINTRSASCGVTNPAPSVPQPVSTTFGASTEFLTTTPGTGQYGVTVFDANRRAVVRGYARALGIDGLPTSSQVTVAVKDHADWGTALTDASGAYAIVVNGGGDLVITFAAADHITADRHVRPEWNRYAVLDDVALVELEPATTVTPSPTTYQVATGAVHGSGTHLGSDGAPTRQATLFFPPNVSSPALPNGNPFGVRITELTGFSAGPTAMPATLPPSSGYTYAMDISIDGVPEGTDVTWTAPIPFYIENFANVPSGTPVPLGFYNRAKGAWIPEASGIALTIVNYVPGTTEVKDTYPLNAIPSQAERAAVGARYPIAGTKLWRVALPHFSTWDANWGFAPPVNAGEPPDSGPIASSPTSDAPTCPGSILECQNQVLGEDIPIAGTPFSLHYQIGRAHV